jgi:hypothetical protein
VTFEKNKIFGSHGQAEDGLQYNQPRGPRLELFESGERTEQLRILYRLDDVGLALHVFLEPILIGHIGNNHSEPRT